MTLLAEESIRDQAIAWHLAVEADGFDDWPRFVEWLEADTRNNAMYEAVADADLVLGKVADLAPVLPLGGQRHADNDDAARTAARRQRGRIFAMAATVALVFTGSWIGLDRWTGKYAIVTAPGEARTMTLADGTRIALNGSSRIVLDKHDPRFAELAAGEAKFSVRHDPADPFELIVGDQKIVDVGTVFNVQKSSRAVRVEVAEGGVRYEDGSVRLRLNAGDTLQASGDSVVEGTKPVEAMGTWTQGRLVYSDEPLVGVVADLSRSRGVPIELGPNLSNERFTGVIQLDGDAETVRKRFARLLGHKVAKTSDGWSITR